MAPGAGAALMHRLKKPLEQRAVTNPTELMFVLDRRRAATARG